MTNLSKFFKKVNFESMFEFCNFEISVKVDDVLITLLYLIFVLFTWFYQFLFYGGKLIVKRILTSFLVFAEKNFANSSCLA